uniref:ORF13 n=1 Tax=Kallithea virus TaxID=1654582 RepID=A0A0F7KMY7_9VIRU|nr:ORF13 [Kallithea virus]
MVSIFGIWLMYSIGAFLHTRRKSLSGVDSAHKFNNVLIASPAFSLRSVSDESTDGCTNGTCSIFRRVYCCDELVAILMVATSFISNQQSSIIWTLDVVMVFVVFVLTGILSDIVIHFF